MRIIGGAHRGLRLASLGKGDPGAQLRPTPDRVRESLFNVLAQYGLPDGAKVLDLFAGTGALGLEALSRGASFVTFVENGRAGQRLIRENLEKARPKGGAQILTCDARKLPVSKDAADLVFLDPPYGRSLGAPALASAAQAGWLRAGTLIVWEESAPQDGPSPDFAVLDTRKYGDTFLTILEVEAAS